MRKRARGVVVWAVGLCAIASVARAQEAVNLSPGEHVGDVSRVSVRMKAQGHFLEGPPPGSTKEKKAEEPKKLDLKVEMMLDFDEKLLAVDQQSGASQSVRKVSQAGTAINGQIRPSSASLRPEVTLLVGQVRPNRGLVVTSPSGPLLRSELELVQGPCDPLLLAGFLPGKMIKVGEEWNLSNDAARALTAYDALATNNLVARLDAIEPSKARGSFKGTVRGAVLGGEGTMECSGTFVFDRAAGRIAELSVERKEQRKPGQIEAGLDVSSTIKVTRMAAEAPPELAESILSKLNLEPKAESELLSFKSPDDKYTLLHDRDWHIAWDSDRVSVLKRLDAGGDLVAQCNLQRGPSLGKGQHQSPKQFRDDLRKGLGERFVQILGEGEVEGTPEGGYAYKVAVQGREGDVGVIWYYYLLASPSGEQLLATFTLGLSQQKTFGNQDLQLIGSLAWLEAKP